MRPWMLNTALGLLATAFAGCRSKPPLDSVETFLHFERTYFSALFRWSPSYGTLAGFHEHDDALEDWSAAAHRQRTVELQALRARLAALPRASLSPVEQIDAELLAAQIDAELFDLVEMKTWQRNPMAYVGKPGEAIDALMKRDFAPVAERVELVTSRLRRVPDLLASLRANVHNPPREFTDLALAMAKGSTEFLRTTVPDWAAANVPRGERLNALGVAARQAADAMQSAAEWIEHDLMPRSHGAYAIGAEAFLKKLRYEEGIDWPLDKLLATGEANLQRDQQAFAATAALVAPGRTPAQAMALLADDHPAEPDLLPATSATLEKMRQFLLDRQLVTLPFAARPLVAETPPFARNGAFAAMDSPGSFETKANEAFYYITPPEPGWEAARKREHLRLFNRPVLDVITMHEAFPGHYVQFLYASTWPSMTRKLLAPASNAEGWAHYAEQMMIEEGYGQGDPRLRLAQLSEALLRDCRYVVGIKMHTQGMTVEQGARFFVEHGYQEPANAYEEARRGAYNPTYLYYTLGKLLLYELRADYQRKHGGTLRQFHDAFLRAGPLPFPLLRRALL
jgi:uncharacterized protein (DUF885 family)